MVRISSTYGKLFAATSFSIECAECSPSHKDTSETIVAATPSVMSSQRMPVP